MKYGRLQTIKFSLPPPEKPQAEAFSMTNKIYGDQRKAFFDTLTPVRPKAPTFKTPKQQVISLPSDFFKSLASPEDRRFLKADPFRDPSVAYMSKLPLAYNKKTRLHETEVEQKVKQTFISKTRLVKHLRNKSLPPIEKSTSPLSSGSVSPKIHYQSHSVECDPLDAIFSRCKETETLPRIEKDIQREKFLLKKYTERMDWTTDMLRRYSDIDHYVMTPLISELSKERDELEEEEKKAAKQVKEGNYDLYKSMAKFMKKFKGRAIEEVNEVLVDSGIWVGEFVCEEDWFVNEEFGELIEGEKKLFCDFMCIKSESEI